MSIYQMQTEVINKWGFEHPNTIQFFADCEQFKGQKSVIDSCYTEAMMED